VKLSHELHSGLEASIGVVAAEDLGVAGLALCRVGPGEQTVLRIFVTSGLTGAEDAADPRQRSSVMADAPAARRPKIARTPAPLGGGDRRAAAKARIRRLPQT
jgi:hypothetical protein